MNTNTIYDRVAGCLIGGALGDALGYTVEFFPWETIRKQYGQLRELQLTHGKALFSDDTQMTLFTNEGLTLHYWQDPADQLRLGIYPAYLCWLNTQEGEPSSFAQSDSELMKEEALYSCRAPGSTCLSALRSGRMGTIEEPINDSKGCGGVMRSAPAGFFPFWFDPLLLGAGTAAITHSHPGGWIPAGMLSDIVCRCIFGRRQPLDQIIEESLEKVRTVWKMPYTDQFTEMIRDAMYLSRDPLPEPEAIHSLGGGWVGDEALAIAIYSCMKHPDDIKEALITAVNHTGDSDSTGAIVGNILGAYHGLSAIPEDWTDKLELNDVILRQAEKSAKIIADNL